MILGDSTVMIPTDAKAVDPSSADVNLATLYTDQTYVRGLYNGNAAAKDIKVTTTAGSVVTYANVPSGGHIYGLFKLLWQTGTTATGMVAEK